jgi:hypothetical protein
MRVSEELQVLDLSLNPSGHITANEFLSGNNLQGDLLLGDSVYCQLDLAKGAFSEGLNDLVSPNALFGLLLRRRLNRSIIVAILFSASTRIGRLVLSSTICGRSERDLQLPVLVGAVRHHCGGVVGGGIL